MTEKKAKDLYENIKDVVGEIEQELDNAFEDVEEEIWFYLDDEEEEGFQLSVKGAATLAIIFSCVAIAIAVFL